MLNKIVLLLLFLVIILVFYFSWLPDSQFTSENYMPQWLLNWSNKYYNLRTAIPFIAFGFLLGAYSHQKNLENVDANKKYIFIKNIGVAAIIACIAECGQFLIKGRSPDLMDVYYGTFGSLIGATIYNLFNRLRLSSEK